MKPIFNGVKNFFSTTAELFKETADFLRNNTFDIFKLLINIIGLILLSPVILMAVLIYYTVNFPSLIMLSKYDGHKYLKKRGDEIMESLKPYIGTKIVNATEMAEIEFLYTIKHEAIRKDAQNRPGYLLIYPDGFKSWLPKETFEKWFRLMGEDERKMV